MLMFLLASMNLFHFVELEQFDREVVRTFLRKHIDQDIDPCEDFYAHVCHENLHFDDLIDNQLRELYEEQTKKLRSPFLDFLDTHAASSYNHKEIANDLQKICAIDEKGFETALKAARYISEMDKLFAVNNSSCEAMAKQFLKERLKGNYRDHFRLLRPILHGIEFAKSELAKELDKESDEIFEKLKKTIRAYFNVTPWLNNNNGVTIYERYLCDNISLTFIDNSTVTMYDKMLNSIEKSTEDCRESMNLVRPSYICLLAALSQYFNILDQHQLDIFTDASDNAANLNESIVLRRGAQMHACVSKQYKRTCQEFLKEKCHSGNTQTEEEDGADLASIRISYATYKIQHIQEKSDIPGITEEQMFFYAMACRRCQTKEDRFSDVESRVHSPGYVRINALMSQMQEWKKAFGCSEKSRMIRSKADHCELYGAGAPLTRKILEDNR
ncbi:unnamed protein product [Caenorhabditis auriculariae]|uniref:Peptidase M13 C-terminal domain-containing protein n=1 Tax=Caenorhabditis auriculariae TaxID=2777116 RepID=A0A8S1GNT3_9PELO|nr:unnamed protein product [Caenorhabditis auriculariae]